MQGGIPPQPWCSWLKERCPYGGYLNLTRASQWGLTLSFPILDFFLLDNVGFYFSMPLVKNTLNIKKEVKQELLFLFLSAFSFFCYYSSKLQAKDPLCSYCSYSCHSLYLSLAFLQAQFSVNLGPHALIFVMFVLGQHSPFPSFLLAH